MIISLDKGDLAQRAINEAQKLWKASFKQLTCHKKGRSAVTRAALYVAMYRILDLTLEEIAYEMHRHHSGILYHVKNHKGRMSTKHRDSVDLVDPIYYENYNAIARRLIKLR